MKSHKVFLQIIILIGLVAAFMLVRGYEDPQIQTMAVRNQSMDVGAAERIKRLEPETPVDMRTPFISSPFPSNIVSPAEILENGRGISPDKVYSSVNWERPSYKSYWHSTISGGRWSYLPTRVQYAMHRLFAAYLTASVYSDFVHDLGIAEESKAFNFGTAGYSDKIAIVVMQADISKIVTKGNQVILVGKPQRTGLQVLAVPVGEIVPATPGESILFQLVTQEGDEFDYSLIRCPI